jgi:C4-dicarboxylate-specific signal transduction histidine kinase
MIPPEHDKARAALEGIVNAGHRTSKLIDGFLALFAKGHQERQVADLNEIIRHVLESFSSELKDHNVEVRSELIPKRHISTAIGLTCKKSCPT